MLGVRLSREVEQKLERYARDMGRTKSTIVRDWIVEKLERESIDEQMRQAAALLAKAEPKQDRAWHDAMSAAYWTALEREEEGHQTGRHARGC